MEPPPVNTEPLARPSAGRVLSLQPDALLCTLSARGNEDAFGVLHARYRQQVFAFVFHLLGRPDGAEDAEDLTQEIMQKAYSNLTTRRNTSSFKAWLFRIARNHTFDHIRARKPNAQSLSGDDMAIEPSNVVSLQGEVERRAELAWLVGAMSELPERQRYALVMRELGGLSVGEIAESLETTPESAKQLIKRGRSAVARAAEVNGYRSKKLGRELAAAAPITAIAWLGAPTAGAATAAGISAGAGAGVAAGGVVAGGAAVGGTAASVGVLSGKALATILAATAIGAGGIVASEKAISNGDETVAGPSIAGGTPSVVPAAAGVVGENAASQDVVNKERANERRTRAAERRAKAKSKQRGKAKAKRDAARAKGRGHGKSQGAANRATPAKGRGGGAANGKSEGGSSSPGRDASPGKSETGGGAGSKGSPDGSSNNSSSSGKGKGQAP